MKFGIIGRLVLGSLVFGTCSFLVLYVLDIRAELHVQPHPRKLGQTYLSSFSVKPAASELKVFRRGSGKKWTAEEEALLLELRGERKSWEEIDKHFPTRKWTALRLRYFKLTRDGSRTRKIGKQWTEEEKKLLLDLVKKGLSYEEIAQYFPGRTTLEIKNKYKYLSKKGRSVPKSFIRRYSPEEDKLVLQLEIEDVPWKERVKFFNNRTLLSLRSRLSKLKSLDFTAEEDQLLLELEKEKEAIPWTERVTYFNNRNLDELQIRLKDLMSAPARSRSIYTPEEDDLIVEAVEKGMTVEGISQLVERTTMGVKIRIKELEELGRIDQAPQLRKGRNYTAAELKLMHELVEKGVSWSEIATKYLPGRGVKRLQAAYYRYQAKKRKEEEEEEEGEEEE